MAQSLATSDTGKDFTRARRQRPFKAAYDFLSVAVPVSTLSDLVTYAKSRSGSLNRTAAPGAPQRHLLRVSVAGRGLVMTYVPYRSSVLALPDLITDQTNWLSHRWHWHCPWPATRVC